MTTEAVEALTPGGLRALLASPQSTAQTVGKVVAGGTWYLAVPVSVDRAARLEVQRSYEIRMTRTGEERILLLERITDADASGEVLLIFCAKDIPLPLDLSRSLEVEIVTGAISGIFVPMVALREENAEYFVLVDLDGVAAKRRVEPLVMENGYCLVAENSSPEFLQQGECVLVTPRRVYEGKALK